MKKEIKIIALAYVLVAVFTYALSIRVESLDNISDTNNHNRSIVLKLK